MWPGAWPGLLLAWGSDSACTHAFPGAYTDVFHCRCVCDRQRSFALGIQWILVRTLGTVLHEKASSTDWFPVKEPKGVLSPSPVHPSTRLCLPGKGSIP